MSPLRNQFKHLLYSAPAFRFVEGLCAPGPFLFRVIWHGPVITGLLWLGLSSDHRGRRLSCDLTWTNDRRWVRNKDLLDVGVDRLFDINTYVCTSRFPFSCEQTNPDEPRQGCDPPHGPN